MNENSLLHFLCWLREREWEDTVCVFPNVPPDWMAGLGHYTFSPWWIKECWRAYRYASFLLPVCAPKLATSATPRQLAEAVIKTSTASPWFQANYNIYNCFRAHVILCIAHSLLFLLCRLSKKSDFFPIDWALSTGVSGFVFVHLCCMF